MAEASPAEGIQDQDQVAAIDELRQTYSDLRSELAKVIVGQDQVIEELVITLFARGHALLMGVPGLAKTLLISSLAETMSLSFSRIQFTPDLMPMDITGTDILQDVPGGKREFEFIKGPIFANIVLADEINRAPAKTQAALLEAMQERKVTVMGDTYRLEAPYFVLATQNPVEQEGTYPLPEAQLDRFMFLINVDYPARDEEIEIARSTTGGELPKIEHLLNAERVLFFQDLIRSVPVPQHVYEFAVDLVRKTRPQLDEAPAWIKPLIGWGAGPRAVQCLILGGKARAALHGRYMVQVDDLAALARPVLSHRIVTTFHAESEGYSSSDIVQRLLEEMEQAA